MFKRKIAYKQGVIKTDCQNLIKGQIVEIIEEREDSYKVRAFLTGNIQTVKKEDVSLN